MIRTWFRSNLPLKTLPLVAVVVAVVALPAAWAAVSWSADSAHTAINFSVNHFFTPVTGSFNEFEIDLEYDPESPQSNRVSARISVASVDTGNEKRDNHLRSVDFFDADTYPYITFESESVREAGDGRLVATGPLTIKGKSRQIELPINLLGIQEIPEEMRQNFGGTRQVASFQASTAIDRGDYEVGVGNFAATLVVGGEVSIDILVEAHAR